jgi:hypothetical protein
MLRSLERFIDTNPFVFGLLRARFCVWPDRSDATPRCPCSAAECAHRRGIYPEATSGSAQTLLYYRTARKGYRRCNAHS